jgi:hypothetical protein
VVVLCTTTAGGQTLFARPDTTPDYASYQHFEECITTVSRIADAVQRRERTIWWDTVGVAQRKALHAGEIDALGRQKLDPTTARPDAAIQAGRACLARFNADTATFQESAYALWIFQTLLLVHRDDDAHRFAERFLDSMRKRSATDYKNELQRVLESYLSARPIRYAEAKQYHAKIIATVAGDSLYRSIRADRELSIAAQKMGDTLYANELAWRAIRTSDAMPVEERKRSYDSMLWMNWLEDRLAHFTETEGFDSLAISNVAYNMYKANTVRRRVYGGKPVAATDAEVQPYKVPDLVGEQYYTSTSTSTSTAGGSSDPSGKGLASYTKRALPPGTLPVKGRINYIISWPSFCHAEGEQRPPELAKRFEHGGSRCTQRYNTVRMFKELYPDLEIIVLSNTYGTVGKLSPLTPADEADTLAKLFLGHGRVPAHLVVEHTPFFPLDAPDGRRIDLPTPQMELLGKRREMYDNKEGIRWLVDKEGYVVSWFVIGGGAGEGSGDYFDRFYSIVTNRPSRK